MIMDKKNETTNNKKQTYRKLYIKFIFIFLMSRLSNNNNKITNESLHNVSVAF